MNWKHGARTGATSDQPPYSKIANSVDLTLYQSRTEQTRRSPKILYAANIASFFNKFLLPYGDHFRSHGWQVDAMSKGLDAQSNNFSLHFDNLCEIDWARKPHEIKNMNRMVRQIREFTAKGDYDIVHVHTPVAAMLTRFALRNPQHRPHTKIIYTAHGFHFFEGAPKASGATYKRLEQVASRWTDYLVVMNSEDHASALALKHMSPEKVLYMPGIGIDLDRYRFAEFDRQHIRGSLNVPANKFVLLCTAEFIPRKRQSDVLQALAMLRDDRFFVLFAGDGETLEQNRSLAEELNVGKQVRFLGHRTDVPKLLAAADAYVLPSSQEGLPRSVMEAMCAGVPVIATNIRGTRDLLHDDAGILYPVADIPTLARAIWSIGNMPGSNSDQVKKGLANIDKYDVQKVICLHEDLYALALEASCKADVLPNQESKDYVL